MGKLTGEEFEKSLNRLQGFAKSSTQLHHTASDSNPGSWPGGAQEDLDDTRSNIDDNGTDYNGVRKSLAAKIRKSQALTTAEIAIADGLNPIPAIQEKLSKGLALTPAESWAASGGFDVAKGSYVSKASTKPVEESPMSGEDDDANSVPETNAGGAEKEIEADAKKSFDNTVNSSLELSKGLELSPFLYELTNAIGHALGGSEGRIVKSLEATLTGIAHRVEALEKSQAAAAGQQEEFRKSLATAVVGIGESVSATADATAYQAQLPVGAPKSQMRQAPAQGNNGGINVMSKSYGGPGGLDLNMSKSVISDALVDLCKSNEIPVKEVIRFESTDILSPQTSAKVEALVAGRN
jgi:hypothetical protein